MTFMTVFPLLVLALFAVVAPATTVIVFNRRRQQREAAIQQSAREKMAVFRAAGVERTQMMDFSQLRINSK